MKKQTRTRVIGSLSIIAIIALLIWLGWYFSNITIYIIISLIVTLLATPLKELLMKIKISKTRHIGNHIASALSLILVICIFVGLMVIIAPTIVRQVNTVMNIDSQSFSTSFYSQLENVDNFLRDNNVIKEDESLEGIATNYIIEHTKQLNISSIFGNFVQMTGEIFLGIFSVLFISFFFLKDIPKVKDTIVNMVPDQLQDETSHVLLRSKDLLSNYFVGLFTEIVVVILFEFTILSILKISNALLIAVIGGVLVIIPYLGSIVACVIGCILAIMGAYISHGDILIVNILIKVISTFIVCRLLDNFFLQPYIASKSVKAHPLEIFLVVLVSGTIAGIPGMMLGIPAYTILRIIAQEFFGNNNFVKTLTKNLREEPILTDNNELKD
ncbi:MAG: AI-2E family transporter [Bacteroidales bacterium]|jgi:predicted PurR-regulated permease PerM|nr:AI-2E family transporter [Bacteroidales bacterium]MCR5554307.1 AI-2E family transporter [Bacteroidales bacterium]